MIGFLSGFFLVSLQGCASYPDRLNDEPRECFHHRVCLHESRESKKNIDCSKVYEDCSKANAFEKCTLEKDRPKVYSQDGKMINMSFQSCFDKRR